ncbi:DUF6308 family protein [Arthrobacter sp.]|uniref:DUF6308 family protein n=1 Tax=Arthrobacter sp. TaxID=1667 RepID=UPI003A8CDDD6
MDTLRVGGATITVEAAEEFISRYVRNTSRTWSYPAYDAYPGHSGPEVGLADIPAIGLLNAGGKAIKTYYGFQELLPLINKKLSDPALHGTLADASAKTLDAISALYGVLDTHRPPEIGLVKLSKVLHRKRPALLPLYDRNILRCYQEIGIPAVPYAGKRSTADFMRSWLPVLQQDLVSQLDVWKHLTTLVPNGGHPISPLRALDMIGWHLGDPRATKSVEKDHSPATS